jgi:hypothetical protein
MKTRFHRKDAKNDKKNLNHGGHREHGEEKLAQSRKGAEAGGLNHGFHR